MSKEKPVEPAKKYMIEWDEIRKKNDNISPSEEALILRCFNQYIDGNDCFENVSSPEMRHFFEIFKNGWIMQELFIKGK